MTDRLKVDFVDFGTHDGRTWGVEASTEFGHRFHHPHVFDSEAQAHAFVKKVERVGSIDTSLWTQGRPCYGSDAFVAEERQAHAWAQSIRAGHCSEEQVPDSLRTLL